MPIRGSRVAKKLDMARNHQFKIAIMHTLDILKFNMSTFSLLKHVSMIITIAAEVIILLHLMSNNSICSSPMKNNIMKPVLMGYFLLVI